MLKWFLLILLLFLIYYFFFRKSSHTKTPKQKQDSIMLECAECGVYVSSEEVIVKNGKYYCSKECAKLH